MRSGAGTAAPQDLLLAPGRREAARQRDDRDALKFRGVTGMALSPN